MICESCASPMPVPADLDCFTALGLPHQLVIDGAALEAAYHDLGRRIHPDRFASAAPAIRALSLSGTALLTRSYRTLRDPIARGLYWLELQGEKLAENNKSVPTDLAELVFDIQEQLADLRTASGDAAIELRGEVDRRRVEVAAMLDDLAGKLGRNFSAWDASPKSDDEARKTLIAELKTILSKIAYLRTLLRDIDRGLETLRAA